MVITKSFCQQPDLPYHTSAIVASALDTVSLLYRLRSSLDRLSDLTLRLVQGGRVAGALSLRLPLTLSPASTLLDTLESWEGPLTQSLTPLPVSDSHSGLWLQSLVLRGLPESRLMRYGINLTRKGLKIVLKCTALSADFKLS